MTVFRFEIRGVDRRMAKLATQECHNLYSVLNRVMKSRTTKGVGYVACAGMEIQVLLKNTDGQRQLGRHGRSWDDDIKTYIKETTSCVDVVLDGTVSSENQRVFANAVMNQRMIVLSEELIASKFSVSYRFERKVVQYLPEYTVSCYRRQNPSQSWSAILLCLWFRHGCQYMLVFCVQLSNTSSLITDYELRYDK